MIRSPPFVYNIHLYEEHYIIEVYKDGYWSSTLLYDSGDDNLIGKYGLPLHGMWRGL